MTDQTQTEAGARAPATLESLAAAVADIQHQLGAINAGVPAVVQAGTQNVLDRLEAGFTSLEAGVAKAVDAAESDVASFFKTVAADITTFAKSQGGTVAVAVLATLGAVALVAHFAFHLF